MFTGYRRIILTLIIELYNRRSAFSLAQPELEVTWYAEACARAVAAVKSHAQGVLTTLFIRCIMRMCIIV